MFPETQAPLCFSQVTISQLPKWMLSKEGLPSLNLLLAPPCESQTAAVAEMATDDNLEPISVHRAVR